jgi:RNA polymerase sigma-70 factor (ECF subfamily)
MTDIQIQNHLKQSEYEKAFNGIVSSYTESLYWHIRRFLCCHEDADDLLQGIFIKIWSALPTFRAESKIYTWIYRIATNEVLNHLRKMKVRAMLSLESSQAILEKKIDEDTWFNGNEIQRELHKAIQRLPEKPRIIFSLRYFNEMKYEDISEVTGTSVGALKASYHHAYNRIKKELEAIF